MTDERWHRVKLLFEAAVERPSEERLAFLTAETANDAQLRAEVESLLAADVADDTVIGGMSIGGTTVRISPPPRHIGPYEIIALIGAGAMGDVYRARDTKLNRDVALKVLPPLLALDPDRAARFKREAQVLAALNHPHIAAIYGLEESEDETALVLELVDGPTLADRIEAGALPLDEVLSVGRQIAEALEAAHEKGIIHRDLKPANVKIAGGRVKVLDFGLAKAWEGAPEDQLSTAPTLTTTLDRERTILGTPAYMSPEQARGRALDKRTDIWSFGCVLFEMLTGQSAFGDQTISDTLARVLDRDLEWNALPSSTPDSIRDLLRRCVQKDVSRRLRDIGDARIELEEAVTSTEVLHTRVRQESRHDWYRFAIASAVLAVVVLVTAYIASRDRAPAMPSFRQLTFRHGTITGARLASDGQTVVYRATFSGAQPEIFVIRPDSLQSGSIGLPSIGMYAVSSRGDLAVALGCRLNWGECLGTLGQVPITGGSPRQMVKDVIAADWGPDGRQMAVVSFNDSSYRLEYPIEKVLYTAKGWISQVRVSPNGDRVAFIDHDQLGDTSGSVSVMDVNGHKTTLSADWKSLHGLAWSPTGNEVWFSGSRTGKSGISTVYAVTLDGHQRAVFSSPGTVKLDDISRDGERVLLTRGTTRGGIVGLGADSATERDLSWLDYSTVADLSADGKTLLFYEWGEGVGAVSTIFIRETNSTDAVRLGEGRPLALSPDARWVLAVRANEPQPLVVLPAGTGDVKRMPRGPIIEYLDWAAWLPDGRRFLFAGRENGDIQRTYIQDADGGEPRAVTPNGYVALALSPDGHTIVTVDRYGEYYVVAIEPSSEPRPLAGYRDGDVPLQWSADGRFLFIREAGNLTLRIFTLDLATGARRFWKQLVPPDPTVLIDIGSDPGQIRLTPDGKAYAYTYWTFQGELYLAQGLK